MGPITHVGALIIRIGFLGIVYYTMNRIRNPPKIEKVISKAPILAQKTFIGLRRTEDATTDTNPGTIPKPTKEVPLNCLVLI